MNHFVKLVTKLIVSYLIASTILLIYLKWPNFEAHAHVPFSGFPAMLVFAPAMPFLIFSEPSEMLLVEGSVFIGSFFLIYFILFKLKAYFKDKK